MDVITYAKSNKIKTAPIPPTNRATVYTPSQLLKASREKVTDMDTSNEEQIPFTINSVYCNADSSRIKYYSPFDEELAIKFADSQLNMVDKFLCLNPKQIGLVNSSVDLLFDYGNQLHYFVCKNSIIDVFQNTRVDDEVIEERLSLGNDKIIFFDQNNRNYSGYGDLNLNNILFASILFRFGITKYEKDLLTFNSNLATLYNLKDVKSLPYKADYSSSFASTLSGSYVVYGTSSMVNTGDSNINRNATDFKIVNVEQKTGFTILESPLNFVNGKSSFNEYILIDRTHPLWEKAKVTIKKGLHYTANGNDITYVNPDTQLSTMDELLKTIYSWNSCLIILEKENALWDKDQLLKPRYTYEFLLLVGLKTKNYKITEKIEFMFYITAGDNYINNSNFSKKDIFFIKAPLKKILNIYKPDAVHFFDLSTADYGNICKNGLLFGMESELQTYIINKINNKDTDFVKTSSTIENLYELFEQL